MADDEESYLTMTHTDVEVVSDSYATWPALDPVSSSMYSRGKYRYSTEYNEGIPRHEEQQ